MAEARVKQRQRVLQAIARGEPIANSEVGAVLDDKGNVAEGEFDLKPLNFDAIRQIKLDNAALEKHRILPALQDEGAVAAYKMLRTRVAQRMRANGWRALAVTSTAPNEGKTLTATNLAISLAGNVDQQVFLVDLDLRRPSLHQYLGFTPDFNLADYLEADVPLEDILVTIGIDRLWVLPNRRTYHNSSEMLASPHMARLVSELMSNDPNRLIIFDLPPILAADDLLAFSPYIDAVLLVAAEGKTRRADLSVAKDLLQNINMAGVVLNRSSERTSGHYYPY
jgi:capsular exopolysaccharide synthesis family protein